MPKVTLKPNEVKAIPLSLITPDPENIRRTFDDDSLQELAADIKSRGLEQPITVTKSGDKFMIKHGERRFRASQLAKLKTINCILGREEKGDDKEFKRLIDQWAENMQRQGLNAIDEAWLYRRCRDDYGMKITEIPTRLKEYGVNKVYDRSTISTLIKMTELPQWAQDWIRAGRLTPAHGRLLSFLSDIPAEVVEQIREALNSEMMQLAPEDPMTVSEMADILHGVIQQHFALATYRQTVHDWEDPKRIKLTSAPVYDIDALPEADRNALNIISVPVGHNGGAAKYIINVEAHKQRQQEALDAIIAKRTKAEKKVADARAAKGNKQEKSFEVSIIADHVTGFLQQQLQAYIKSKDATSEFCQKLLFWHIIGAPYFYDGSDTNYGIETASTDLMYGSQQNLLKEFGITTLTQVMTTPLPELAIPDKIATYLCYLVGDLQEIEALAVLLRYTHIKIEDQFRIDADYLSFYGKKDLIRLATEAGLNKEPGWIAVKAKSDSELRDYLLEHRDTIGCPGDVLLLLQEVTAELETNITQGNERYAAYVQNNTAGALEDEQAFA